MIRVSNFSPIIFIAYWFLKDTRTTYGFYLPHTWEDTATEKEKNKTLIGLNTPLHNYYTAQVPVIFKKKFRQVTSCINVIDFEDLHLSENSFLPDGDHLTKVGAILTSNYLQSILKKNSFK